MNKSQIKKKQIPILGKLALKYNFITKDQLKRALILYEEAEKEGQKISIAEIFVRTQLVLPENMKKLHKIKMDYEGKQEGKNQLIQEISLIISEDKLKVELLIPKNFKGLITTENVLERLQKKGVINGIVKDYEISNYINNTDEHGKSKLVARGTPVYKGTPPVIEYFFDSEYFRNESLRIDSGIVKKKGNIAEVEEGDLLIQKTPMIPPDSGINVFGDLIDVKPLDDFLMRAGSGTELFEQEMKIVATSSGVPFISVDGTVNVFQTIRMEGDYGVGSGPVGADSSLVVKGIVTGEYLINGGSIVANEIRGANINVLGDINVKIGITDSVIKCQGDVNAKYIHGSVIETYGSVISEKEILDSKIISSGICKSMESKIIASVVAAKRGVKARGIGSEFSLPCKLTIGFDLNTGNEIKKIEEKIGKNIALVSALQQDFIEIKEKQKDANKKIISLMDLHKQIKNAIASTEKNIAAPKPKESPGELENAGKTLNALKRKIKETILSIRELSEYIQLIDGGIDKIHDEIIIFEKENEKFKIDKEFIAKWSEKNECISILEVDEDVSIGTLISGENSFYETDKKINRFLMSEKIVPGSDPCQWEMLIEQPGDKRDSGGSADGQTPGV